MMSPPKPSSPAPARAFAPSSAVRQFLAVSTGFLLGAAGTCAVQAEADLVLDASVKIVVDHGTVRA